VAEAVGDPRGALRRERAQEPGSAAREEGAEAAKSEVDHTYASIVEEHLASVVPYFQKEGQAVGAGDVRRLVNEELPMIRENLSRAERLEGKANVKEKEKVKDKEQEKEKSSEIR
jgi:hypothetical protein